MKLKCAVIIGDKWMFFSACTCNLILNSPALHGSTFSLLWHSFNPGVKSKVKEKFSISWTSPDKYCMVPKMRLWSKSKWKSQFDITTAWIALTFAKKFDLTYNVLPAHQKHSSLKIQTEIMEIGTLQWTISPVSLSQPFNFQPTVKNSYKTVQPSEVFMQTNTKHGYLYDLAPAFG